MIERKLTNLAAIGCFAVACAGSPGPSTDGHEIQIQSSQASFAPQPADTKRKTTTRATAEAKLTLVGKRKAVGTLELRQRGEKVTLAGQFRGLPVGLHGLQIHENGDCGGRGASKSGSDYNPTETRHGPPESGRRHVGDLGNIEVDRNGRAVFEMETNSMTIVKDGPSSVLGRSVVVTENKDDGRSQPDGNAGPAIACGVIR
jgi:Cu-Zn family superoxide dismutase